MSIPRPAGPSLFPCTPLFRSQVAEAVIAAAVGVDGRTDRRAQVIREDDGRVLRRVGWLAVIGYIGGELVGTPATGACRRVAALCAQNGVTTAQRGGQALRAAG